MHLLDNFGYSLKEIEKDGFKINDKIYMALDGYNKHTVTKSMGVLMSSFVDTVNRINPDWIVIAGDRGETLIASIVAAYTDTPIAHIQAGEVSGNIDGAARHAIGKFAHLHFASNEDAQKRLIKLGEEKFRIKLVGAPQLDDLNKLKYNNLITFKTKYNINLNNGYLLVIYHPPQEQIESIKIDLNSIFKFLNKIKLKKIWISPNNDAGSSIIKSEFLRKRKSDDYLFDNLPRNEYLILLKNTRCIIGNSSSGILESPTFKTPCINIGKRQFGRLRAKNIIDVNIPKVSNLLNAYKKSQSKSFKNKIKNLKNPYGDGNSSERILKIILNTKIDDKLMFKKLTY